MSEHLREGPFDFDFFGGGGVGFCNFGKFVKIKKNKTMHCWEKKITRVQCSKRSILHRQVSSKNTHIPRKKFLVHEKVKKKHAYTKSLDPAPAPLQ